MLTLAQEEAERSRHNYIGATVTVLAPAATIAERVPRDVVVEPVDDNNCLVHASSHSVEMLALYLGLLDAGFTVTQPPELVSQLEKLAARFRAAVA